MMHITYFSEYTLPCQSSASRALRQPVTFAHTQNQVVYWLAAMADFGLTQTPLLPLAGPAAASVTYRLNRTFRPAGRVIDPDSAARLRKFQRLEAPLVPNSTMGLKQPRLALAQSEDRNYLQDQQQNIYGELVARPGPTPAGNPSARQPTWSLLSVAEITRDLAGWTTPQVEVLHGSTAESTPKRVKLAAAKMRHNQFAASNLPL